MLCCPSLTLAFADCDPVPAPRLLQAQYTRSSGASPDYLFLLQRLCMDNPDAAVNLAKMVAKQASSSRGSCNGHQGFMR